MFSGADHPATLNFMVESCYKALARSLRVAVEIDPRRAGDVPSTKGVLGGSLGE